MYDYIGIVKTKTESAIGLDIRILTKFSDNTLDLENWMQLYPNAEKIIIDNNEQLEEFFKEFEDFTPVLHNEKVEAQRLYENLMKSED